MSVTEGGNARASPCATIPPLKRALQVLFPYAVFLLLALVSWNRWIQPYVDSGRELMVPRRIAQGERLYRDVQFFHGPLAPYAGAAIERAAPGSLGARIAFAALLALWNLEALRRLAARLASPGRAALATSLAVALAYFLQPGGWLFPFSFDTAAAVAAVTSALVFASGESPRDGWAGFCLLVALLSRPEIGLAAMAALLFEAGWRPRRWPSLAILPLAASAVVYAAVSLRTPVARLVSGGWLALVHPPAEFQNVYRVYAGLDRPGFRVVELALVAMALVLLGALLAAASAVSRSLPPRSRSRAAITAATMALVGAVALAALARLLKRLRRRPPTGIFEGVPDSVLFLAALLGARLLLAAGYAGPYNAFFLPLPVVVTCGALWRAAEKARDSVGPVSPARATGSLAVLLGFRVLVLADVYRRPGWTNVATPAGSVRLAEPVAWTTSLALQDLAGRNLPRRTLAGFPEGGFFHYVLNLKNPLPADQFFPGRFDRAGEEEIVRRLESDPPDAVVLVNVLAVGEGATAFGKDYNVELGAAIERDFRVARAFGPGARPGARIGDPGFFIEVRVPAGGRP